MVKDSGVASLLDSYAFGGLRRSSWHKNAVNTKKFVNHALMSTILETFDEPSIDSRIAMWGNLNFL